ncbi:MAG: class I SAM-dependent methyltransferase [Nitrospinae bacterium]|nr:class I SAM-dependent methyltransferase [Nitrospinota bacterium]
MSDMTSPMSDPSKQKSPRFPKDDILAIWNRIMQYQVDFSFPLELQFYLSLGSWLEARNVVDLGTGNGYYLRQLASYFRNKFYTGIDFDERLVKEAQALSDEEAVNPNDERISYDVADVLSYTGEFSVGVARLLVQHLDSSEDLFIAARNFLKQDGTLVVIDSNDNARFFWPTDSCRQIDAFFRKFSEFQPGRNYSDSMMQSSKNYGFEIEKSQLLLIPSSLPTYKNLFHESYHLFFDIVQGHYGMPFDYESLRLELDDWARNEGSYSQIGVNLCSYRRVG